MRLLILGGTVFLGRHLLRAALDRGDHVTIFHRGRHALDAEFEGESRLDVVHGDRRTDLGRLGDRQWDAVFDTSGFLPSEVMASATALGDRVDRYLFVSSISVYPDLSDDLRNEDTPLARLTAAEREEGESLDRENPDQRPRFHELYGALKVACEQELERALPGRLMIVRPGLIVGPYDPTDRFTYWVERGARGGAMLAPGPPQRPVQFVDVRDLAEWMLGLADMGRTGTLHASGPSPELSLHSLLDACIAAGGGDSTIEWCDEAFLEEAGVGPWMELPLWLPASEASMRGMMRMDVRRALDAGLTFRPLATTVQDTLAWAESRPDDTPRRAGLAAEKERDLLTRWAARRVAAS